jgi:hypothetical protein
VAKAFPNLPCFFTFRLELASQNGRLPGWEHSDSSGWRYLGSNVRAVSAGQQGMMDILYTNGNAYFYSEANGSSVLVGSNVSQVTTGTDANGNVMVDLLHTNGNLYEWRAGSGWSYVYNNVQSIAKGRAGVVDMVFTWGDAYDHSAAGWTYLTGNARTAA